MLNFLEQNKDITNLSGYKTKAIAKYFFELKEEVDLEKLGEIIKFSEENELKVLFLGGGTNILFAFDIFEGIIIKNNLRGFEVKDGVLEVNSGELISFVSLKLKNDFQNNSLDAFIGLPGTVGGAVAGNAGCFGLEIKDIFINATLYSIEENMFFTVDKGFMQFGYRTSFLKNNKNYFLIKAKFSLDFENKTSFDEMLEKRKNQPKGLSCGSFFKNPEGTSAGKLIDEAGLKGTKIGGAFISSFHANFLMSNGVATYQDILDLKNLCQKVVFEKIGVELKEEINILSN